MKWACFVLAAACAGILGIHPPSTDGMKVVTFLFGMSAFIAACKFHSDGE